MVNYSGEALTEKLLESETIAELLLLFRRNPGIVDDADGVARKVGRRKESIDAELHDLVQIGIVRERKAGKSVIYSLNSERDAEVQTSVGEYLADIKR